ncbi:MAG: hypothetical protein QE484_15785 [Rhizobium sp.]|nr:hypothetical protein [Rhizobium sp.]
MDQAVRQLEAAAGEMVSAPDRKPSERQPGSEEQKHGERGLRVRLLEQRDTEAVRDILKQHHAVTVFRDQPF